MLSELCRELKNWFDRGQPKILGDFTISNNRFDRRIMDKIQYNQYFRIVGSVFNDGVYCFNEGLRLTDETFHGAIWLMAVPNEILDLANDISEWQKKYGGVDSAAMSPFNSESFGGYSYSKSTGSSGTGSNGATSWQSAFANRMNRWRKI